MSAAVLCMLILLKLGSRVSFTDSIVRMLMRGELDSIRVAEGLRLGILTTTHILVML